MYVGYESNGVKRNQLQQLPNMGENTWGACKQSEGILHSQWWYIFIY